MSIPALLPDPSSSGLTAHRCLCPAEQPGKQSTAAPWERAGTGPLSRAGSGRGKLRAAGTVRALGRSGRGGGSHSPACSSGHSPVAPGATHLLALVRRQPVGQEGAESALAHAALAGQNQHHVPHAPQPLPQRRRLRCGAARPRSAPAGPAPARLAPPPQGLPHPGPGRRRQQRTASGWGIPGRRRPGPPGRCRSPGSLQRTRRAGARAPAAVTAPAHPPRLSPSGCGPPAASAMAPTARHIRRAPQGRCCTGRMRGRVELSPRGEVPELRRRRPRGGRAQGPRSVLEPPVAAREGPKQSPAPRCHPCAAGTVRRGGGVTRQ